MLRFLSSPVMWVVLCGIAGYAVGGLHFGLSGRAERQALQVQVDSLNIQVSFYVTELARTQRHLIFEKAAVDRFQAEAEQQAEVLRAQLATAYRLEREREAETEALRVRIDAAAGVGSCEAANQDALSILDELQRLWNTNR